MQLVLDDVELHHRVRAEHGRSERQTGVVVLLSPVLPLLLGAGDLFRLQGGAAQLGQFARLRIVLFRGRRGLVRGY